MLVKKLTCIGELQRPTAAFKQLDAQFRFQILNLPTQRRLCDEQFF